MTIRKRICIKTRKISLLWCVVLTTLRLIYLCPVLIFPVQKECKNTKKDLGSQNFELSEGQVLQSNAQETDLFHVW